MTPDADPFRDIWPITKSCKGENHVGIPVSGIGTISLFVILKDRSLKNVMLKNCLYIPG
jgi:hypothetical protein